MAAVKSVWGIDIGQCALKALKLVETDGGFRVEAFEVVEHSNVLSQPDVDVSLVVRNTLDEFLRRVDLSESKISVSVLGQSGFTRFVKLPPVEKSKIPDIVRFEAEQQIPFPIEEVTWRYQTFQDADSPEVEAGIFAMKQVDVAEMLAYFVGVGLDVDIVQMAPLALYNFMAFDGQITADGATMLADVGADKTHLVVADGPKIWTRTIQIGGNNFTEALVKSFKLSFTKAERLKRTAAASKYARQIFQVMRPVFADLVQEIQRSIGYYTSLNRDSRFERLLGMGNGFRLPGMQKYLEQNLNMSVVRLEEFGRLSSESPNFKEYVLSLGVAYGLAIQGMDQAVVRINLLPEAISRKRQWGRKRPWFVAAAAAVLLGVGLFVFRSYGDWSALRGFDQQRDMSESKKIVNKLEGWRSQEKKITRKVEIEERQIAENMKLRAYSRIWPAINSRISAALLQTMTTDMDRKILRAFPTANAVEQEKLALQVQSDQARLELIGMLPYRKSALDGKKTLRERLIDQLRKKTRGARQILILEEQSSLYQPDLALSLEDDDKADKKRGKNRRDREFQDRDRVRTQAEKKSRGFEIVLEGRTSLSMAQAVQSLAELTRDLRTALDADPDLVVVGKITNDRWTEEVDAAEKAQRPTVTRRLVLDRFTGGKTETTTDIEEQIDPRFADPLFPGESTEKDVIFTLTIHVAVTGSGLEEPSAETNNELSRRKR